MNKMTTALRKNGLLHLSAVLGFGLMMLLLVNSVHAHADDSMQTLSVTDKEAIANQWGIELVAMRLSAANNMLDFRYRVIDGKKSVELFNREKKPFLLHQKSGKAVTVQNGEKIGALRNTDMPKEGRTYWMFFRNFNRIIAQGDLVTVRIGDFQVKDIPVE